jgi:esterase/lipase
MFNSIKKAVIANRIKKAATPAFQAFNSSTILYLKMITRIVEIYREVLGEATPIVCKHADRIAEAVVILEPMLNELKEIKALEQLKYDWTNDEEAAAIIEDVSKCIEEIKDALKAV